MRKASNSDDEKDWHYYLTNETFKEHWNANKKFYISFFIIGLVLLLSIAYCNRHFGG